MKSSRSAVPDEFKDFVALNAEIAPKCPSITERKPPLASYP